jgi:hypothetical protein
MLRCQESKFALKNNQVGKLKMFFFKPASLTVWVWCKASTFMQLPKASLIPHGVSLTTRVGWFEKANETRSSVDSNLIISLAPNRMAFLEEGGPRIPLQKKSHQAVLELKRRQESWVEVWRSVDDIMSEDV